MAKIKSDQVFDWLNNGIMLLVLLVIAYPLYFVLVASVSDPYQTAQGTITFYPRGFTLIAYKNVFANADIWTGYANTVIYTLIGTALSLLLTISSAYVLSKSFLPGRRIITWYYLIPMYFNGGLIPTYLLVRSLSLINRPYTLIVLGAFSVFNLIITRSFFQTSIPETLYEAAYIDGASHLGIFFKIALPLSLPIIAVMALYYGVAQWNGFFNALVYVSDKSLMPLQIILRNILIFNETALDRIILEGSESDELAVAAKMAYIAMAMKYALIMIASLPLLMAYPFVQKFFVKGVMVGSLKG